MGIPTYIDPVHGIAHNKIIIVDREVVITGSFNFTRAAEETTLSRKDVGHDITRA
jgi:phosphatidylserine/phosphatidylglycerophosphate/cardiolipin synthase-like enzyme